LPEPISDGRLMRNKHRLSHAQEQEMLLEYENAILGS